MKWMTPERVRLFLESEDGATTSDFVVLAAAIVGLGFAVVLNVSSGAKTQATGISRELSGISVSAFGKSRGEEDTGIGSGSSADN